MTRLGGVPVKTRLPASAWILVALVAAVSLMPSLLNAARTSEGYQASMTQLLGVWRSL
jgi:hypothetical protein